MEGFRRGKKEEAKLDLTFLFGKITERALNRGITKIIKFPTSVIDN